MRPIWSPQTLQSFSNKAPRTLLSYELWTAWLESKLGSNLSFLNFL